MAGSDAILVVEEWISEHYFTTDARSESFTSRVLARRKEWEALKQQGQATPQTRLSEARQRLLRRFATLSAGVDRGDARDLNRQLREILGYDRIGYTCAERGPVTWIRSADLEEPTIAIVDALPVATIEELLARDAANLTEPFVVSDRHEIHSVARLLSMLFVGDEVRPEFGLVLAGSKAILAERTRWAEGRYLVVDLQLVLERGDERRGGEVDRALTCLAAESIAPGAEGEIWWAATLAESVNHTVGVRRDLREGVRLSVELLANEVVRRRRAQGLDPLRASEAQPLAKQALRFLYRILFLLYAEASPELGVLPTGAPEYERGYSLDRLRDLTVVPLTSPQAQEGTHVYDSLAVLFKLVDSGHDGREHEGGEALAGLTFRSLRADLFLPQATAYIDEVRLGNGTLQQVLRHLLLRRASRGRDAGFISYAELGINQLGAVYEGLMSYTGSFAETDLNEVARDGDATKGSWVVPVERSEGIATSDFICTLDPVTDEPQPVVHRRGSFVFRLAGREREQSASYYTPEVLTRFVVSQALEELLDQDGEHTSAEQILALTVCEPALGSGAFAIEAVRQLAEQYLLRRQEELGEAIDPDEYPRELQKVKAYLALHQVYGVDLNATAVELAEISLWLDTMVRGLTAPWFGLHLRRGNSLIGARKAVFSDAQVRDRSWLSAVPQRVGSDAEQVPEIAGRIPHFLLPADGWGSSVAVRKEIVALAPGAVRGLRGWARQMRARPARAEIRQLVDLGHRVERLWQIAERRLEIADGEVRRDIPLWGRTAEENANVGRPVTREEIQETLNDRDGAYQRLRRVMDAWCALWFWPLTEEQIRPPTREQWLDALVQILGRHAVRVTRPGQETLSTAVSWDALAAVEETDRAFSGAAPIQAVLDAHPWLTVCEHVAARHGFFHWELDFAPVFARGGFDLQIGNPPWVRPRADVDGLLAEFDPWWALTAKPSEARKTQRRPQTLALPGCRELVVDGTADTVATAAFIGDRTTYPHLVGLQPNLYRCFMEQVWSHQATAGIAALVHPEAHFTESKAGLLRAATYRRLRRHWQFINELKLFEIQNQRTYGVHVYGAVKNDPVFTMATSLYHPDTVTRSLVHDGSGEEPGLKDPDGNWDLRPHRSRLIVVDASTLDTWHATVADDDTPAQQTAMVYSINQATASALAALSGAKRIGETELQFSRGWDESIDRTKGFFDVEWGTPERWDDVILQGAHLHVGSAFYRSPNESMRNKDDLSFVDLEMLARSARPVTIYKPTVDRATYDASYGGWDSRRVPARSRYRVAWRAMAANTGERTLIPAIIPPGTAHVHGVSSCGFIDDDPRALALTQAVVGSLLCDMVIRSVPASTIQFSSLMRLPSISSESPLADAIITRVLRLNCLTDAYADLWWAGAPANIRDAAWTGGPDYLGRRELGCVEPVWTVDAPLRRASDRRQALLELDALIALALALPIDVLCTVYRSQFSVLHGYDRRNHFDANGRLVPSKVLRAWRARGDRVTDEERTATNQAGNTYVYELPFVTLDREADMRNAYAQFERILEERERG